MNSVSIQFIKKIVDLNLSVEEIEKFFEEYSHIRSYIYDYSILENRKKISKLNKNRKNIIDFIDNHQDIINKFIRCDVLYEMTNGFDVKFYWKETYKALFEDILKVDKEKIFEVITELELKGFKKIYFHNKNFFTDINNEKIKKKYNSDEYDIKYYCTDGQKKYLAQYYKDDYPVLIENAKIVYVIKSSYFLNILSKEVHLKTFDVDINSVSIIDDVNKILDSIPFEKINIFTDICEYVRKMNKTMYSMELNKKPLLNLLKHQSNRDFYILELKDMEEEISKFEKKKELVMDKYISLGYDKLLINKSIDYLNNMEWNSHIDVH